MQVTCTSEVRTPRAATHLYKHTHIYLIVKRYLFRAETLTFNMFPLFWVTPVLRKENERNARKAQTGTEALYNYYREWRLPIYRAPHGRYVSKKKKKKKEKEKEKEKETEKEKKQKKQKKQQEEKEEQEEQEQKEKEDEEDLEQEEEGPWWAGWGRAGEAGRG